MRHVTDEMIDGKVRAIGDEVDLERVILFPYTPT